jgi:hypothetical protein
LLEPQRTNWVPYSERLELGYSFAYVDGLTITQNTTDTLDPFGGNNAEKFVTTTGGKRADSYSGAMSGLSQVHSIFAKAGTASSIIIECLGGSGTQFSATFNLSNGTVTSTAGTVSTSGVQAYANGWYRCYVGGTGSTSSHVKGLVVNGTGSVYMFGWMWEEGTYPTSYIPTTSAAVTRLADVAYKSGISSLIGTTSGTAYMSFVMDSDTSVDSTTLLGLHYSTSTSNRIQLLSRFGTVRLLVVAAGGIVTNAELYDAAPNELVNVAFTYGPAGVRAYVNGTQVYNTATAVSFNETFDLYTICNRSGIDEYGKGQRIAESLLFKNQVLTNAQLAEITTL